MGERIVHGRRFVARMHHAVGAFLVIAGAVSVPIGPVHQLVKSLRVAFAQQIAGLLPAEDGARRITPRRAVVALVAGEKVEEQAGLAERPLSLARPALEYAAEQLFGLAAIETVLLIGCTLIGVTRRYCNAIDAQLRDRVKECGDAVGLRGVKQSAIDVDAKAALLGV